MQMDGNKVEITNNIPQSPVTIQFSDLNNAEDNNRQ